VGSRQDTRSTTVTSRWFRIVVVALLGGVVACADTPTGPSTTAPYSQLELRIGSGVEAVVGNTVSVNYTGWLYDPSQPDLKGLQFDSSVGLTPLVFQIGVGGVIAGFDRGVTGMRVGGARRVIIPPSLGYGGTRNNSIPPFSSLVFDIELVEIAPPATGGGS
jgi:FKBP-type peptidyl-prolyl cis-trans isomerase FkpA